MKNFVFILIALIIFFSFFYFMNYEESVELTSTSRPLQKNFLIKEKFVRNTYEFTKLASYNIEAKILSKKRYRSGREADISPIDFALGWQEMTKPEVIEKIKIKQSNRWYYWRCKEYPIPKRKIEKQSANVHIIPANEEIKLKVLKAKKNDLIRMSGFLVEVNSLQDNWKWKSSTSRNDTGNGACEVFYVEEFTNNN